MFSKTFRRAIEGYDETPTGGEDEKDFIVMKGPLSEIYTQALNKLYAKDSSAMGAIATETQANDALMIEALATDFGSQEDGDQSGGVTTVYGVDAKMPTDDDMVDISRELQGEDKFVLIIDGVRPGPNSPDDTVPAERAEVLSAAMEAMVLAHKGQVYHSVAEYARSRKKS